MIAWMSGGIARSRRDRKRFAPVASGGRRAVTDWRVLRRYEGCCLLLLAPKTGRTHQLRAHLASIGHPIACDWKYGDPAWNRDLEARAGLAR